mgnify:CR=1 FL=1
MSLVGDDREGLVLGRREPPDLIEGERESLDGADNDLLSGREGFSELLALAATVSGDDGNDTLRPLKALDRLL